MTDLDRLEELLAKATPGKLVTCGWGDGSSQMGMTNIFNEDAEVLVMEGIPEEDAALIVATHNQAPVLITELRQLREIVREAGEALEPFAIGAKWVPSYWPDERITQFFQWPVGKLRAARALHNKIKEVMG